MGIQLDARQRDLQSEFRAFASEEIAPRAGERKATISIEIEIDRPQ